MGKYRKKPVEVEVTGQFFSDKKPWPEGVKERLTRAGELGLERAAHRKYVVITIHGQETDIVDGDWIIQEPDAQHHYPCKPDIFEQTYEKV